MQFPILHGVWSDGSADIRASYPVNMVPVVADSGLSAGYLRPADGIVALGNGGPGVCRGGIAWNGYIYRVMGTQLVKIGSDGSVVTLGDVGGSGQVSLDYGFDRLMIVSNGKLWYYDGTTLTSVTAMNSAWPNMIDGIWADGYYMITDGQYIAVTDIANPLNWVPLSYAGVSSAQERIVALKRLRSEVYAVNRYSIEVFQNTGATSFGFSRVPGAVVTKGAVGTHAVCLFADQLAFVGSGRGEAPAVYLAAAGGSAKISTREVDILLKGLTDAQLSSCLVEARHEKGSHHLWVHLPDRTMVYDLEASQFGGTPVWFVLTSATDGFTAYGAQNLVWANNVWNVGNPSTNQVGYLTDTISSQWGNKVRWEFSTQIIYGESNSVIFHSIELHAITGRIAAGADPRISTSFTLDGIAWSQDRSITAGRTGDRTKNLVWFRQGWMRNWRIQRFRGDSDAFISVARLEIQLEKMGA